ncbi:MAG: thiamine pyrophosphate-dependent enzyme, partial [Alphaproteobacteria bacterium]
GDALSIGGNHLLHVLRRNVDLQFLLFNNEIYGLTKGQYSPTSRTGTRSPSTPKGSIEGPVSAASFALGSGARFVGRSVDTQLKHMPKVLKRAHEHKGASFVEIFQNCIVYNDNVFGRFTERDIAANNQIDVEHGKPLIFGKEADKGLRVKPGALELEVVTIGENGVTIDDILVHDETNVTLANMLAAMDPPNFPVAIGVIYCNPAPTYVESVRQQAGAVGRPSKSINDLLRSGHTWRNG